ncbi:MAG: hypothetical protein N3D15_10000 [Syntrophorhabdaceae bacterium]|nr:hypothetical protein [Syntrophorhabdaceae bacterium]
MRIGQAVSLFLIVIFLSFNVWAFESGAIKDTAITIENTARYENYDFWGDPAGSPYQNTGGQFYNEMNLSFSRRLSQYELFQGRFDMLYNDSRYRSQNNGFVLERGNLLWEKGDAFVPFRTQVGDSFSFMTIRTIQRSLKGLQAELQPAFASKDRKQSLLFFTGTGRDDYRDFTPINDLYSGASYLIEDKSWGNYSINLLQNHRASEIKDGLPSRNQWVGSITGEKVLNLLRQRLTFEGEVAYFKGDYNPDAKTTEKSKDSFGLFGQLNADTGTPFTYRLRYENYGKNYKPNASSVNRDYEAYEAHAGWRFKGGMNIRGRLQNFIDGVNSGNPLKTYVAGLNLTGPFIVQGIPAITTSIDAFIQDAKNRDRTTNTRTSNISLNLSMPVKTWAANLTLTGRNVENFTDNVNWAEQRTYETNISATHAISIGSLKGSIAPGLIYQRLSGNATDRDNYGVSLAIQLAEKAHQIGFNARFFSQNAYAPGTINEVSNNLGLNYRYNIGPHTLGLEANYTDRDPTPGTTVGQSATQAYKIAFFYTIKLEKEPGKPVASMFQRLTMSTPEVTEKVRETVKLVSPLAIGQPLDKTMTGLADQGITGGIMQPGIVVYETRLLEEIDQRQRLVLVHDDKLVTKTALIIDFDDVGNQATVSQTFERVKSVLLKRFGPPSDTYEQLQFTPNFVNDVNTGRLIRIMEWKTDKGTIRFGIPQRLDRQVRMELQYAPTFPSRNETFWGIEAVR